MLTCKNHHIVVNMIKFILAEHLVGTSLVLSSGMDDNPHFRFSSSTHHISIMKHEGGVNEAL